MLSREWLLVALGLTIMFFFGIGSGSVSQVKAGQICEDYGIEGEGVQVSGPIECGGSYWVCEFMYYGVKQSLLIAVSEGDGRVADGETLRGVMETWYSLGDGSYIFKTVATDPNFGMQMDGMNVSLNNYGLILKSLEEDGYINQPTYVEMVGDIEELQNMSENLSRRVAELYNTSERLKESADCETLGVFIERLNETLLSIQNFSSCWGEFIDRYNNIVSESGTYIPGINPSNAEILKQQAVAGYKSLRRYKREMGEFEEIAMNNLKSREERKETKEELDRAYEIIKDSGSTEAVEEYNNAVELFNEGEYRKAKKRAREAIALAGSKKQEPGGESEERGGGWPISYYAGIALVVLVAIILLRRHFGGEEEGEEGD